MRHVRYDKSRASGWRLNYKVVCLADYKFPISGKSGKEVMSQPEQNNQPKDSNVFNIQRKED